MKKLLNIFILTLCMLIAGCDNDDSSVSVLKVIQSDVTFKAAGGTGSIRIEATGDVTAVADADWCTIKETSHEMVTFDVKENYDFPGRSAQIIIRNEANTQRVTVTQQGAIIIYNENDLQQATGNEKSSLIIALKGSFPFKINIPEDAKEWLSYELVDEGIQFNFEKNTTNTVRGTSVEITNGVRTAVYVLMQYDAENLLGSWVASFNRIWQKDSATGKGPASIKESEENGTYVISLPNSSLFPMTLEATYTDHGFKIASGQYQGETKVENEDGTMTTTLYIYSGIASGYYSYWFPEQSVNLAPTMINGEIVLTLQDNGSAEGDTIADLLLGFFLEKDNISQNTFVPSLTMDIYNLRLFR